jgi:hypothetical protein
MNEQKQAERLAAWLEDANNRPDVGLDGLEALDADVRETLIALRPELAPAPRVSVDDILAGVTEGPLAATEPTEKAMPVGASVGAAPEDAPVAGSSRQRRPWLFAVLGVGGVGSLVAAAAVLLVVGSVATMSQDEGSVAMDGAPAAPMKAREPMDAVAMEEAPGVVDTGMAVKGDVDRPRTAASRARPKPARKPRPSPRPQPAFEPEPEPEPDAVAFADDPLVGAEGGSDVYDSLDDGVGGLGTLDEDAARTIPEVRQSAPAGRALADDEATAQAEPVEKKKEAAGPQRTLEEERRSADEAPRRSAERAEREMLELDAEPGFDLAREQQLQQPVGGITSGMDAPASAPVETENARDSRSGLFGRRKPKAAKGAAPSAAAPPPMAPTPAEEEAEEASMDDMPVDSSAAPTPPPPSTAQRARQGVETTTSPEIEAAKAALAAGTPRVALGKIEAALGASPSRAVRQHLLALKGDALLALGDRASAEAAWNAAIALQMAP